MRTRVVADKAIGNCQVTVEIHNDSTVLVSADSTIVNCQVALMAKDSAFVFTDNTIVDYRIAFAAIYAWTGFSACVVRNKTIGNCRACRGKVNSSHLVSGNNAVVNQRATVIFAADSTARRRIPGKAISNGEAGQDG